jgi:hypothetical protein
MGVCTERGNPRLAVKREFQVEEPQEKEYQCKHGGGNVCSSVEASVMEVERRDIIIRLINGVNRHWSGRTLFVKLSR